MYCGLNNDRTIVSAQSTNKRYKNPGFIQDSRPALALLLDTCSLMSVQNLEPRGARLPGSFAPTLGLFHTDIEYQIPLLVIVVNSTPVPLAHDVPLFSRGPVRVFEKDWDLEMSDKLYTSGSGERGRTYHTLIGVGVM
jgi:hypothetical protein